jgi:hypothetical protein
VGEGADRVKERDGSPRRIEGHIETLRHELGDLVGELDRRRHEAFDLRAQARRHPVALAVVGVVVAALVGIGVALVVRRRSERERPLNRARRARLAMERLIDDPERFAHEPRVAEKVLAAAGTALASILVKRAMGRAVPRRAAASPAGVE